ncbi:hypothetical protein P872_02925 [Rhodonellum psychrophilum GCM71 = DSM 17998]|uniref:Uncharacterized protein n=2 Tax=Rhodonellum TaxID=336827 RepID=U5C5V6_9BACT|nr:hypothetical protein P872_02925 [Rhodonellum psychrophilum GCM71 = DSM 17998]SDY49125.1 hypothetical protein SAMN05444412_101315 [Rhodonellum ikkaensis]
MDLNGSNPKYAKGFQIGIKPKENQTIRRIIPDTNWMKSKIVKLIIGELHS